MNSIKRSSRLIRAEKRAEKRAESRGLAPHPLINPGPMSRYTIEALTRLGREYAEHLRDPPAVTDTDFERADLVLKGDGGAMRRGLPSPGTSNRTRRPMREEEG